MVCVVASGAMPRAGVLGLTLASALGCGRGEDARPAASSPGATVSTPAVASAPASAPAPPAASTPGSAAPPGSAVPADGCRDLASARGGALPAAPWGFAVRGVDASTPGAWATLKEQRAAFALLQVAVGTRPSPHFADNWRTAKACGLPRGAYHFVTPRSDGTTQARMFLEKVGDDRGELAPVVDVELAPGCAAPCCGVSCEGWAETTRAWLAEVEKAWGRKAMVYTVKDFWKECLCNTSRFGERPLWLAGYPSFDLERSPGFGGWVRWVFYQYKGNARLGESVVDLDVFRGTPEELAALLGRR